MERQLIRDDRTGESYVKINHDSGLTIYIRKMEGYSTKHALFGTRYGSINTRFRTKDEPDFADVPEGIAHFLEHKLFENEDCDVFTLYAKTGASANAYTSFDKTAYLFSCTDNFEQSLEILLDFVQKPYFTQETVDKEQGIIGQEIRMYEDVAGWRVFFNMLGAMYKNHPVRIEIAGTDKSIACIDAPLLYRCYNTFYNLHNMVLSIAGDVDENSIMSICDRLLKPCRDMQLETAFEDEPDGICEDFISQKLEVSLPLFNLGYKSAPCSGEDCLRAEAVTNVALSLIGDASSDFYKTLYDEGLINSTFSAEVFCGDGYFCSIFGGESRNPAEVKKRIIDEIARCRRDGFSEERFVNIKKSYYGSLIRGLEDVEEAATTLLDSHMRGVGAFDLISIVADMTLDDVMTCLEERFAPEKCVLSVINPVAAE